MVLMAMLDGCLDLGEVPLGFAEELFSFAVIGGKLTFLSKGLGVPDKLEVAEAFLTLYSELDGLH
jgi:hypothetical protein